MNFKNKPLLVRQRELAFFLDIVYQSLAKPIALRLKDQSIVLGVFEAFSLQKGTLKLKQYFHKATEVYYPDYLINFEDIQDFSVHVGDHTELVSSGEPEPLDESMSDFQIEEEIIAIEQKSGLSNTNKLLNELENSMSEVSSTRRRSKLPKMRQDSLSNSILRDSLSEYEILSLQDKAKILTHIE